MNTGILIGKIILWIFVIFGIGVLGYLFFIFIKVSQKKFKGFFGENKSKKETPTDEELKYCSKCGTQNKIKNLYCINCGEKLK